MSGSKNKRRNNNNNNNNNEMKDADVIPKGFTKQLSKKKKYQKKRKFKIIKSGVSMSKLGKDAMNATEAQLIKQLRKEKLQQRIAEKKIEERERQYIMIKDKIKRMIPNYNNDTQILNVVRQLNLNRFDSGLPNYGKLKVDILDKLINVIETQMFDEVNIDMKINMNNQRQNNMDNNNENTYNNNLKAPIINGNNNNTMEINRNNISMNNNNNNNNNDDITFDLDTKMLNVFGIRIQKSKKAIPKSLANAGTIIETMVSCLPNNIRKRISNSNVIIYHCDPTSQTGYNLEAKKIQYDYITDIPVYKQYMQNNPNFDGKKWDETYGVSGNNDIKTTVICDLNLIVGNNYKNRYGEDKCIDESILVHEFGITILNLGIKYNNDINNKLQDCYIEYLNKCPNAKDYSYSAKSYKEMFGIAVQTWFCASKLDNERINYGLSDINALQENAPQLYNLLNMLFKDNVYKFVNDIYNKKLKFKNIKNPRYKYNYLNIFIRNFGDKNIKTIWNYISK